MGCAALKGKHIELEYCQLSFHSRHGISRGPPLGKFEQVRTGEATDRPPTFALRSADPPRSHYEP